MLQQYVTYSGVWYSHQNMNENYIQNLNQMYGG